MSETSGTPLVRKLGIKPGATVAAYGAPDDLSGKLEPWPEGAVLLPESRRRRVDVVLWFVDRQDQLERRLDVMARRIGTAGSLWVAWPKRASGVPTDLDGNVVREAILDSGLVDNKICAVDGTWSALRGVVRLRDR